jgi:actin-like ATPase involved in cell morphogenesis
MEKKEVEEYLKKLEEFEKSISSDDDELDLNFMTEVNELLSKLQEELQPIQPVTEQNIINTQPTMTGGGVLVKVKKLLHL